MEIKTKYNVGDKVWIMRNNKPEKIQISNIEVEVIGDVPVGTCSLSGEYYTKIILAIHFFNSSKSFFNSFFALYASTRTFSGVICSTAAISF